MNARGHVDILLSILFVTTGLLLAVISPACLLLAAGVLLPAAQWLRTPRMQLWSSTLTFVCLISQLELNKEARRQAAWERFQREQKEQREREAQRDAEREQERQRLLQLRKQEKALQEERERQETEEKLRKAEERCGQPRHEEGRDSGRFSWTADHPIP